MEASCEKVCDLNGFWRFFGVGSRRKLLILLGLTLRPCQDGNDFGLTR